MYNVDAPAPRAVLSILWRGCRSRYAAEDAFAALSSATSPARDPVSGPSPAPGSTPAAPGPAPGPAPGALGGSALPTFYAALNMLINQGLVFFADGGEGGQLSLTALGAAKYAAMVGLL